MAPSTLIRVLRIPYDGPLQIVEVPILKVTHKDYQTIDKATIDLETQLGYIPDIQDCGGQIDLAHHHLAEVNLYGNWVPEDLKGAYLIYKCIRPSKTWVWKLQKNRHFKDGENPCVYGDAFVFALKRSWRCEKRKSKIYEDMTQDFVDSLQEKGAASAMLNCVAPLTTTLKSPRKAFVVENQSSREDSKIKQSSEKHTNVRSLSATQDANGKSKSKTKYSTVDNHHNGAGPSQHKIENPTAKGFPTEVPGIGSAKVQVVRYPCDENSELSLKWFTLRNVGSSDFKGRRQCTSVEQELGHLPDLFYHGDIAFEWSKRSLVSTRLVDARIYMYKCCRPGPNLPRNPWFVGIPGACVFGDAFIFKRQFVGPREVHYEDMEDVSIEALWEERTNATAMLEELVVIQEEE